MNAEELRKAREICEETTTKFKCPQCGNENINEFSAEPSDGGMLNGGIWNIKCDKCNCQTERFAPVDNLASTREVIEWIESEDTK